jgi:hypothetical protein
MFRPIPPDGPPIGPDGGSQKLSVRSQIITDTTRLCFAIAGNGDKTRGSLRRDGRNHLFPVLIS